MNWICQWKIGQELNTFAFILTISDWFHFDYLRILQGWFWMHKFFRVSMWFVCVRTFYYRTFSSVAKVRWIGMLNQIWHSKKCYTIDIRYLEPSGKWKFVRDSWLCFNINPPEGRLNLFEIADEGCISFYLWYLSTK